MPQLRIVEGPGSGTAVALDPAAEATIGRDAGNRLPLADPKSSRVHAELACRDGRWWLRDLGSSNGTWNDQGRIASLPLTDGTTFRIGRTIIRFESDPARTTGAHTSALLRTDPERISGLDREQPSLLLMRRVKGEGKSKGGKSGSEGAIERANAYLVLLHQIVVRAAEARGRDGLFELLDDAAAEVLEGDRCAVFLPAPPPPVKRNAGVSSTSDDDELGGWILWPPHERRLRARWGAVPFARTLLVAVRRGREPMLCDRGGDLEPTASMAVAGVASAMCAPLRFRDEIQGALYVDRLGGAAPFGRDDLEFLAAVANQLAVQLANRDKVADLEAEVERLAAQPAKKTVELISADPAMRAVDAFIRKAGPAPSAVLILGESGTGKELVARALHQRSSRADRPLQTVNCAAIAEGLIESTLFGHVKGAFTGADETRPGIFELADRATLFLDEVGELPMPAQAKLLRALEQGEVQRVGDAALRKVDVRVIAATNRDLATEAKQGRFRTDLLHRLDVLSVSLPPLRERPADVDALADHFLRQLATTLNQKPKRLTAEARAALLRCAWPGNVRQLRNAIERASVLATGDSIGPADLPPGVTGSEPASSGAGAGPITSLAEIERTHILRVLDHCGGNKKAAAELLEIDRSTLYAKLRQYGRA